MILAHIAEARFRWPEHIKDDPKQREISERYVSWLNKASFVNNNIQLVLADDLLAASADLRAQIRSVLNIQAEPHIDFRIKYEDVMKGNRVWLGLRNLPGDWHVL